MDILGIEQYPFTYETLRKNFKELIKKFHPDLNQNDKEKYTKITVKLKEAYSYLQNLAISDKVTEDDIAKAEKEFESDDIFKLWETCKSCSGAGKIKKEYNERGICNHCISYELRYSWLFGRKPDCKACKGTGKFKQRKGKIVDCYSCNGTGYFRLKKCTHCNNTGFIQSELRVEYKVCSICSGLGKIEVNPFNPVIRKAAVMI